MNFQQLRIIREAVRQGFNLTEVASVLFTSQPGVSKHIRDLEDELGVEIFVRQGKRLLGLTEPGKELIGVVERILLDTQNLRRIADQFSNQQSGNLVIATTHTQARYVLPEVIKRFRAEYPNVHLVLHQSRPQEIVDMLHEGRADIGIATEKLETGTELATFACYEWHHALIVPQDHPLLQDPAPTLEAIARYPIITYQEGISGRSRIDRCFREAGLSIDVVLSAIDSDIIKTYVETGLGVGIVAEMAYRAERDPALRMIRLPQRFPSNVTRLALRRGRYLRNYAYRFIEHFVPQLDEQTIDSLLKQEGDSRATQQANADLGAGI